VFVLTCFVMCVCMCGFCNVWMCVCVGFVMCGCFDNCVGVSVICALVFIVFLVFRLLSYLYVLICY
jgi:hypothetical protein